MVNPGFGDFESVDEIAGLQERVKSRRWKRRWMGRREWVAEILSLLLTSDRSLLPGPYVRIIFWTNLLFLSFVPFTSLSFSYIYIFYCRWIWDGPMRCTSVLKRKIRSLLRTFPDFRIWFLGEAGLRFMNWLASIKVESKEFSSRWHKYAN